MPRKSAAATPAAKAAARAKAAPASAAKPAAKAAGKTPAAKAASAKAAQARPTAKSASRPAGQPKLKAAVKAAARSLAAPPPKRAPRKAPAVPAVSDSASAERPVLVRDSFTMPEQEYAVLAEVKQACLRAGIEVKKSELLRIGVALLGQVDIATLKSVLAALPQLKTGRPPALP